MAQYLNFENDYSRYYLAEGTGRLFGRISSVCFHPMRFGMFLGCSIIYLFFYRNFFNPFVFYILFTATVILSLLCGVRSVIGGLAAATVFLLVSLRNIKILVYFALIFVVFLTVISYFPDLQTYLNSITQEKADVVRGSSIEMRLNQLKGAFAIMKENPLFGLGNEWTTYYLSLHGDHPICVTFESLVFVVLCNSGLFGVFFWSYMVWCYFRTNRIFNCDNANILNTLMVFYLSYSIITGEYGYMKTFLFFYVIMFCETNYSKNRFQLSRYKL
jgi:hypothetical protein